MDRGTLAHLAVPGAEFALRMAPRASREAVTYVAGMLRVHVIALPLDGRANAAAQDLLAQALGDANTRLRHIRGGEVARQAVPAGAVTLACAP